VVKRPIRPEELSLWSLVASTVHPLPGRKASRPADIPVPPPATGKVADPAARIPVTEAKPSVRPKHPWLGPDDIEPRRKHRIAKERDPIGGRIDLHGMDQAQARPALTGFVRRAQEDGVRAILVITGKGLLGDGILRRRVPEWLADPSLRDVVAGISEAHRRHGGEGALYVALKRKPRA
jgi:DNA-nicking Smr family endonuclease